jgi:hypothetical protein
MLPIVKMATANESNQLNLSTAAMVIFNHYPPHLLQGGPKVAVVSTLVSVTPAQPFVFRNYQYPPGTRESAPWAAPLTPLSPQINPGSQPPGGGGFGGLSSTPAATPVQSRVGMGHGAYMGSCKHLVWQAIRASSAAPYYMDDFSDGEDAGLRDCLLSLLS